MNEVEQRYQQLPAAIQLTIENLAQSVAMWLSLKEENGSVLAWDECRKRLRDEITRVVCEVEVP